MMTEGRWDQETQITLNFTSYGSEVEGVNGRSMYNVGTV
jgi:hypothetical protein